MGLSVALQDAITGLRATQNQIQVISGNVANAQTAGYSRQTLSQTSITTPAGGVGVNTGIIKRVTDQLLTSNLSKQSSTASAASTANDYLNQLQSLLGQVGAGTSFTDSFNTFVGSMQTLAATPEDPVAQSAVVSAGQQLTQQLNDFSAGIQTLRTSTDTDLGSSVSTLNASLQTIGTLNSSIERLQATGQSTATLEDQRDQALNQVAQLTGVTSYTRADGTMMVYSAGGQSLVDGSTVASFGYTQAGTVTAGTPLSPVTLNGVDVTSTMTTGKVGALLQLRNTALPAVTAELNRFANNLYAAGNFANLNTTNSGTNTTNDAHNIFGNVNITTGIDNASTIEMNPSLVQNPTLLYNGTSGVDPSISATIMNNLNGNASFAAAGNFTTSTTTTLSNYGAQIIGQISTAAAAATQNNTYQSQLQTSIQSQVQANSGVNLDQELGNLSIYQNAYGASARVISTIQSMYQALMAIN
jgi:flagellar hook-associated protein 1 FlgK